MAYTRELIFDTTLGAFYKNDFQEFSGDSPYVTDYIISPNYAVVTDNEVVVDNSGEIVTDSTGEAVTIEAQKETVSNTRLRFLVIKYPYITIGVFKNTDFKDWRAHDGNGLDAEAFMITRQETLGDASKEKQSPYITCYFERTEDGFSPVAGSNTYDFDKKSGCLMQARWDFSDHSNSGKFGQNQQVYRFNRNYIPSGENDDFNYGHSVIVTKNKVKGRGRALSLKFTSEPDKDLRMYGWGIKYTGNENV